MEMVLPRGYINIFASPNKHSYVLGSSEQVTISSLDRLGKNYHLREPLPVRIRWSQQSRCHVAYDDVFNWYGTGETQQEALSELASVILEDYFDLQEWRGQLTPKLQAKLNKMRGIIIHAGQG